MYSVLKADEKIIKKAKGVKKNVVQKQLMHKQYKETLFGKQQLWHGMNILRSEGHEIYSMPLNKVSVSAFASKRWISDDGIHTNAYGYIRPLFTDAEINELRGLFWNMPLLTDTEITALFTDAKKLDLLGW